MNFFNLALTSPDSESRYETLLVCIMHRHWHWQSIPTRTFTFKSKYSKLCHSSSLILSVAGLFASSVHKTTPSRVTSYLGYFFYACTSSLLLTVWSSIPKSSMALSEFEEFLPVTGDFTQLHWYKCYMYLQFLLRLGLSSQLFSWTSWSELFLVSPKISLPTLARDNWQWP